jgi:hypothetical protein
MVIRSTAPLAAARSRSATATAAPSRAAEQADGAADTDGRMVLAVVLLAPTDDEHPAAGFRRLRFGRIRPVRPG